MKTHLPKYASKYRFLTIFPTKCGRVSRKVSAILNNVDCRECWLLHLAETMPPEKIEEVLGTYATE